MKDRLEVIEMATDIVAAYVGNNAVPASELPHLLSGVHSALSTVAGLSTPEPAREPQEPAVPILEGSHTSHQVQLQFVVNF